MNILVADPQVDIQHQVIESLNREIDLNVIEAAGSREESLDKIFDLKPDCVLLEVHFPDGDGIELAEKIRTYSPSIKSVFLTSEESQIYVLKAFQSGAKGYLLKDQSMCQMLTLLHTIDENHFLISCQLAQTVLSTFSQLEMDLEEQLNLGRLSSRELDVFQLVCTGATNKNIAEHLVISENTARIHIQNILKKLNLNNRHEVREKYASTLQNHLKWRACQTDEPATKSGNGKSKP